MFSTLAVRLVTKGCDEVRLSVSRETSDLLPQIPHLSLSLSVSLHMWTVSFCQSIAFKISPAAADAILTGFFQLLLLQCVK